jgi:integrase
MRKSRWGELMPVTYTNHYAFWTLFYSVLAFTGMRPGELAGMTVDRVDFGQKVFLLRSEDVKTKTSRLVPIPERVSKQLYEYVQTLKGEYLFPSQRTKNRKTGKPTIDDVDWGYNFHTRINRLGIKRAGLTPYSLRHSIITRLLDEDVNLFRVQRLVGHSQIATTAHYYHHSTKALQQTVQKDPLARKTTTTQEVFNQLVEHVQQFILGDKRFVLSVDRTKPQEMKLVIL